MNDKITLLDGSSLECFPKLTVDPKISNAITLDTTGEYFSVGRKPKPELTDKELRKEREKQQHYFTDHVHLFLAHADQILSDSRMFLAPVPVTNGLAYTGTSGFRHPTLGVYIEWWLAHKDVAFDKRGLPIWLISGSPLSGRNACTTVDRKGKWAKAQLNTRFLPVWTSFMDVNRRYDEAKSQYMAFSLEEVVQILKGEDTAEHRFKLFLRLEKIRYDNHITALTKTIENHENTIHELADELRRTLILLHRDEVEDYYNTALRLQSEASLADQFFHEQRIELRKDLRSGRIDNRQYQDFLTLLKKKVRETSDAESLYQSASMEKIFGPQKHLFTFSNIQQILIDLKIKEKHNQ